MNYKQMNKIVNKVETIDQLHKIVGFDKPENPLVTVIDYSKVNVSDAPESVSFACNFYAVNFKKYCSFLYGRQTFDHQEGSLHCIAPEQVITYNQTKEKGSAEGWGLYFHPELIRNSKLGNSIHEYTFFSYAENEALHLSDHEKKTLINVLNQIENEIHTNIDQYSNDLIISNIEVILNYLKRFYGRQFITRTSQNKDVLVKFEQFITGYFNSGELREKGIPTVKSIASSLNLSPNYFSDLLKSETGKTTQEHIHFRIIDKAKNLLLNTNNSISEIAHELGFEYPQSFSKLFRKKTGVTPSEFKFETN